jgi:hypothetical protein
VWVGQATLGLQYLNGTSTGTEWSEGELAPGAGGGLLLVPWDSCLRACFCSPEHPFLEASELIFVPSWTLLFGQYSVRIWLVIGGNLPLCLEDRCVFHLATTPLSASAGWLSSAMTSAQSPRGLSGAWLCADLPENTHLPLVGSLFQALSLCFTPFVLASRCFHSLWLPREEFCVLLAFPFSGVLNLHSYLIFLVWLAVMSL